jgi:hypothetical protein
MADLMLIALHLESCGPRAGMTMWVADGGFAGRVDMHGPRKRVHGSSPVFFAPTAEEVLKKMAQHIRENANG